MLTWTKKNSFSPPMWNYHNGKDGEPRILRGWRRRRRRRKDERACVFGFRDVSSDRVIVGEILFALDTAVHSYLLADQYTSHVTLGVALCVPLWHSNVQSILWTKQEGHLAMEHIIFVARKKTPQCVVMHPHPSQVANYGFLLLLHFPRYSWSQDLYNN